MSTTVDHSDEVAPAGPPPAPFDPASITRPDDALLTYYIICSAFTLVLFPLFFIPQLIRFKTLRYQFDDEGVAMSWGILFKKEIYLTYRRIQDIHVTRNVIERWMGLAKVAIQTASGASAAEMTIEGIKHPETLRDFLYRQMRGAKQDDDEATTTVSPPGASDAGAPPAQDDLRDILTDIRDEVRRLADARRSHDR